MFQKKQELCGWGGGSMNRMAHSETQSQRSNGQIRVRRADMCESKCFGSEEFQILYFISSDFWNVYKWIYVRNGTQV